MQCCYTQHMATQTKVQKNIKVSNGIQAIEIWRKLRGILLQKGPKNATAWQRRGRKDRKIL